MKEQDTHISLELQTWPNGRAFSLEKKTIISSNLIVIKRKSCVPHKKKSSFFPRKAILLGARKSRKDLV